MKKIELFEESEYNVKVIEKLFPIESENADTGKKNLSDGDKKNLIAALLFMQCSHYFPFDKEKVYLKQNEIFQVSISATFYEQLFHTKVFCTVFL